MVGILVAAVVISFVIIVLIKGSSPDVPFEGASQGIPRLGELPAAKPTPLSELEKETVGSLAHLTSQDLEEFCEKLAGHVGLRVINTDYNDEHEFHMLTYLDQIILRGNIIIAGYLVPETKPAAVSSSVVIGFSDMVKAERAMKGVFVTNGYFSEEVMKLNEGASIELIDGFQLLKLMQELTPEKIPKNLNLVAKDGPNS